MIWRTKKANFTNIAQFWSVNTSLTSDMHAWRQLFCTNAFHLDLLNRVISGPKEGANVTHSTHSPDLGSCDFFMFSPIVETTMRKRKRLGQVSHMGAIASVPSKKDIMAAMNKELMRWGKCKLSRVNWSTSRTISYNICVNEASTSQWLSILETPP